MDKIEKNLTDQDFGQTMEDRGEKNVETEIQAEMIKLESNFDALKSDVESFGDEEDLAEVLEENPEIARNILNRAVRILPFLVIANKVFNSYEFPGLDLANASDYLKVAGIIFSIFASSAVISGLVELKNKLLPPDYNNPLT